MSGTLIRNQRILVIDDNIVLLKAISGKLRSLGYDVFTAVDGSAAVATVRQAQPDLILLDLNFPPDVAHGGGVAWNGLLILRWLRRMQAAQYIPVIAITGGDLASCEDECRAAGVLGVFLKPLDLEALVAAIHGALDKTAAEHEQAPARKRVLFVDDETDWRYMGTLYLTECGYEVVTAQDAAGALEQAAKLQPDVAVLDLDLGEESGLALMKLLAVAYPQMPILIYSGLELDEAMVVDLRNQGAFECLRKGTMEELLTAVGEAMTATQQETDHVSVDPPSEPPMDSGIESVLIVEDDVDFGDALRIFLETHPFSVTRVIDGTEGLRQISAVDFDVILCDMLVPGLTGEQLYQAVNEIKPHLCNRFVFMTGHQADPRSDDFIRRVHGLMLWKPFHLADLLTAAEIVRKNRLSAHVRK